MNPHLDNYAGCYRRGENPPQSKRAKGMNYWLVFSEDFVPGAAEITKEVNTLSGQNEDVRSIALTMFIQRARMN